MINLLNIDHKNIKKGIELTKINKKFKKKNASNIKESARFITSMH